jgi:mRNA-degrading endonuclease toxin of MazEF toxin-antitoxin module
MRNIPSEVRLGVEDGVQRDCVVNLDTITTIPKAQLTERMTELSTAKKQALDDAIRFALGLRRSS